MAEKYVRKTIRIGGKPVISPRFFGTDRKAQAARWYAEKLKEKDFIEKGLLSSHVPTLMMYSAGWIQKRMAKYPKPTWMADEQRLRDYLLPDLGDFPMDRITRQQLRDVLQKVTDEEGHSIVTRTRVKALASKIFTDAMNENPPLCAHNPAARLTFNDARQGRKKPKTLDSEDQVLDLLAIAREHGSMQALIVAMFVMCGPRKSELIPRKWKDVSANRSSIMIDTHVEQASLEIKPGTKAGQQETREVFVSPDLIKLLEAYRQESQFHSPDDYVFADPNGDWIRPRKFHEIMTPVYAKFEEETGIKITNHFLRHVYGGFFAAKTGNLRALQQQLGHSAPSTTAIYAEMAGDMMRDAAEKMSFRRNQGESKATPKRHQIKARRESKRGVR